jgi:hypothetical protein
MEQPLWTRQPEQRYFEPKPDPLAAAAKQATPPPHIIETPLTPRERQEMEAARLRAIAARARSQAQSAYGTPMPTPVRATPEAIQPAPATASEPAVLAASMPAPIPPPVGRPMQEKAAAPVQDQERARLEEWVNLGASAENVRDAAPRVQRPVEAKPREVADVRDLPLSSLRDLSFAQAMRNLSRAAEPEPATPLVQPARRSDAAALPEVAARPQEFARPDTSAPPSAARVIVPLPSTARPRVAPERVTAQPEILPPKSNVEIQGKEPKVNGKADRRDRSETFDDVQVLPSWRGQYKKR